jgi:hypothetical protein
LGRSPLDDPYHFDYFDNPILDAITFGQPILNWVGHLWMTHIILITLITQY